MNSILLLNIGNTHTQWGYCDSCGNKVVLAGFVDTQSWMQDISLLPSDEKFSSVWAACVVPQARNSLTAAGFYRELHFVDAANAAAAGLDFSMMDASTLGADRIANAAALLKYPLPAACFDCGTAITMEIVDEQHRFAGGAIMPGRKLMRKSLFSGTAALPELPLSSVIPEKIGVNTMQAMALGIDRGAIGMVREMADVAKSCGVQTMVAAGGDAEFFRQGINELIDGGKEFTLRGIAFIAAKYAVLR